MALNDFSTVTISAQGPALSQVGFGTLLCATYHTHYPDLVKTYTDVSQLVTDGFLVTDPGYLMVSRAFQQKPRPVSVKLGRLGTPYTQSVKFGVGTLQNNAVYAFTMTRGAVTATASFTSDGTATAAEIVTGLAAAVEASTLASPLTAATADGTTTCQITDTVPGTITYYSNWTSNLAFSDVTPDPGITADLNAIRTNDNNWYGLAIDLNVKALILAAANWAETQLVLFAANTSDAAVFDNTSTTDVAATMKALTLGRTILYFSLATTLDYSGVAGFAERSTHDPANKGAGGTWAFKVLTGRPADPLTPTIKANLRAKNVVPYITTANRNHTLDGKVIGGEFADKIRFLDWFSTRLSERLATAELNNDIIPYDDRGISIILGEVKAQLSAGVASEGIVAGTEDATAPLSANVSSIDRAARTLNGVSFSFRLAGAIHLSNITGVATN